MLLIIILLVTIVAYEIKKTRNHASVVSTAWIEEQRREKIEFAGVSIDWPIDKLDNEGR